MDGQTAYRWPVDEYSTHGPVQPSVRMLVGSELTMRAWIGRWGTRLVYVLAFGGVTPVVWWAGARIAEAIRGV